MPRKVSRRTALKKKLEATLTLPRDRKIIRARYIQAMAKLVEWKQKLATAETLRDKYAAKVARYEKMGVVAQVRAFKKPGA